jgi:hypothetical protein
MSPDGAPVGGQLDDGALERLAHIGLALLEQHDRATEEAAVDHGEGPLVERWRQVDHHHVGVVEGAPELGMPVEPPDLAGRLDQLLQRLGQHGVAGDHQHPQRPWAARPRRRPPPGRLAATAAQLPAPRRGSGSAAIAASTTRLSR